ncbi:MAG: hypothetical protein P8I78_01255 [Flavobacterium sp.]|nr:hypothetical protein [Flavobacterium sp.]
MKNHILVLLVALLFLKSLEAQKMNKETLFFKYDSQYIKTHIEIPKHYYLDDSSGGNIGSFFFKELRVINNTDMKQILCIKKFIRSSKFYDQHKKLNDYELASFLVNI